MGQYSTYVRKTSSPAGTKQCAQTLVAYLQPGDVVVLNGDLGAGKTHFVQGIAEAMGVSAPVASPTFGILSTYETDSFPLNHFDLYRLDAQDDLEDIAFYETVEGGGVSFIEWGGKFPHAMPYDYLEIDIRIIDNDMREISICSVGQRAQRLLLLWANDSKSRLSKSRAS